MKASVELAASGIQALQVQRRGRNSYRAKASYVDETLFGSHAEGQSSAVEFDPPWVDKQPRPQRPLLWSPPVTQREADAGPSKSRVLPSTPRKKNKYRYGEYWGWGIHPLTMTTHSARFFLKALS